MNVLTRIPAGGREIECGLATTKRERAAVLAQRFRVYQRHGYYRPGLRADRDAYDARAAYFLATLPDGANGRFLLGGGRVILGGSRAGFEFELPAAIQETTVVQRVAVTRVVAEAIQGFLIGGLLTPLGLMQAIAHYVSPLDIRCGLAVIKQRFLCGLQDLDVRLHEIEATRLIYPKNGPVSGYYHRHPDPVDESASSVEQAISVYDSRYTPTRRAQNAATAKRDRDAERAPRPLRHRMPPGLAGPAQSEPPTSSPAPERVDEPRRIR